MITQSDDDDADALYGLAGGDNVINLIAAHYDITDLGTPPSQPGWWGNTEINAKGWCICTRRSRRIPSSARGS